MIVAGFGFRVSATTESLSDACAKARAAYAPNADVALAATADDKAASAAFETFVRSLGVVPMGVDPAELARSKTLTQSSASQEARRTGSVAEAAALAAAGHGSRLLGPRCVSRDGLATCALALWSQE